MKSKVADNLCDVRHESKRRNAVAAFFLTIVAAAGLTLSCSTAHAQGQNGLKGKIWVRMVVFGMEDEGWDVPNEKGQDILNMIQTLQPDMITRFMTGDPDPTITVPMGYGESPMKLEDYIQAAMNAWPSGALITPKLALSQESFSYQLQAAQDLYNMPVTPQLRALDLDTYYNPSDGDQAADNQQTQAIKNVGFKWIGWNFAGGAKDTDGIGDYAYAAITADSSGDWVVSQNDLTNIADAGIATPLAHIDYPTAIDAFMQLTPDQQADQIQSIQQQQHQYGFTFVYPVLYETQGYDASKITTSSTGKYNGMTILQIIAADIKCDRVYPSACTEP